MVEVIALDVSFLLPSRPCRHISTSTSPQHISSFPYPHLLMSKHTYFQGKKMIVVQNFEQSLGAPVILCYGIGYMNYKVFKKSD
jgi:hypothetical protein